MITPHDGTMKELGIQIASGVAASVIAAGLADMMGVWSAWQTAAVVVAVGLLTWLIVRLVTRKARQNRRPDPEGAKTTRVKYGPVQVFLPQWDGKQEGDFYQDGVIQWQGFRQGEKEAYVVYDVLAVEYNPMAAGATGSEILSSMQALHRKKRSVYFVMTMSTKLEEIRDGFRAWHKKCVEEGKVAPVLIATVASVPELADVDNGMLRWYIRSEEECQHLANQLDKQGIKQASAFCITDTPGVSDNRYGSEGLTLFDRWFDGDIPNDLCYFVTAKTTGSHVRSFMARFPKGSWPGVFVIGYGDMVKNTLAELIAAGYGGCVVCTSTLTDKQWRPPQQVLAAAKACIFTVLPRLETSHDHLTGDNRNVVFFFARKTLLRVLKLSAASADTEEFLKKWMNREGEEPHVLLQEYLSNGDILVNLRIVGVGDL